jgi:hypothetical protein
VHNPLLHHGCERQISLQSRTTNNQPICKSSFILICSLPSMEQYSVHNQFLIGLLKYGIVYLILSDCLICLILLTSSQTLFGKPSHAVMGIYFFMRVKHFFGATGVGRKQICHMKLKLMYRTTPICDSCCWWAAQKEFESRMQPVSHTLPIPALMHCKTLIAVLVANLTMLKLNYVTSETCKIHESACMVEVEFYFEILNAIHL